MALTHEKRILYYLEQHNKITVADAAKLCSCAPSYVSRLLNDMKKKDLIIKYDKTYYRRSNLFAGAFRLVTMALKHDADGYLQTLEQLKSLAEREFGVQEG